MLHQPSLDVAADLRLHASDLESFDNRPGVVATASLSRQGQIDLPRRFKSRHDLPGGEQLDFTSVGDVGVISPSADQRPIGATRALEASGLVAASPVISSQRFKITVPKTFRQAWGIVDQHTRPEVADLDTALLLIEQGGVARLLDRVLHVDEQTREEIITDVFFRKHSQGGGRSILRLYAATRLLQGATPQIFGDGPVSNPGTLLVAALNADADVLPSYANRTIGKVRAISGSTIHLPTHAVRRWGVEPGDWFEYATVGTGETAIGVLTPGDAEQPPAVQGAIDTRDPSVQAYDRPASFFDDHNSMRTTVPAELRNGWHGPGNRHKAEVLDMNSELLFVAPGQTAQAVGRILPNLNQTHRDMIIGDIFSGQGRAGKPTSILKNYVATSILRQAFPEIYSQSAGATDLRPRPENRFWVWDR